MANTFEHELRRGLIKVRIRARKPARRQTRFTVTVSRLFKNGDVWKESSRFGRDDVPLVRLALDDAYAWMLSQDTK